MPFSWSRTIHERKKRIKLLQAESPTNRNPRFGTLCDVFLCWCFGTLRPLLFIFHGKHAFRDGFKTSSACWNKLFHFYRLYANISRNFCKQPSERENRESGDISPRKISRVHCVTKENVRNFEFQVFCVPLQFYTTYLSLYIYRKCVRSYLRTYEGFQIWIWGATSVARSWFLPFFHCFLSHLYLHGFLKNHYQLLSLPINNMNISCNFN